jgi:trigger factor
MSNEKDVEKKVEGAAEEVKEKASEAADKAKEEAKAAADKAKDDAKAAADKAKDDAKAAADKAKETADKAKDDAKAAAGKAKEDVKEAGEAVKAKTSKMSNKTVAVIAICVCAVAALALFLMMNKGEKSLYEVGNFDEYIKLGKYKGLTYTKEAVKVTDKEVKDEINTRVSEKSETKDSKKGTVKDGDNVNISYVGKINGKEFDGGTADNQTLTIGSGSFISGFEDGLIGKKVGSKVTLKLKFPKNYGKKKDEKTKKWVVDDKKAAKLAGKPVTFEVTINSRQVVVKPKYNVKFIKQNSDFDNKKDYEASVKEELMKAKEETAEQTAKQTLFSQVVESSEVKKYPKGAKKHEYELMLESYEKQAEQYNMKLEDMLKMSGQNMTLKQFKQQLKTYAGTMADQRLVVYAIADKENLKVTDKEYEKMIADQLKQANYTEEAFKESMGMTAREYADENNWRENYLAEKVMDFIFDNGKAEAPKSNKDK